MCSVLLSTRLTRTHVFRKMNYKAITIVIWTILGLIPINADLGIVGLNSQSPMKKVGYDNIQFECRLTTNNTGTWFIWIWYKLEYNGKLQTKAIISKPDAGSHVCFITPSGNGNVVRAETELIVIEGNERTQFGELGENTKMSCLSSSDRINLPLVYWAMNIDGEIADPLFEGVSDVFSISKTVKEDAFRNYTCFVTTKRALDIFGNITEAVGNGAVAKIQTNLSVIEPLDCKDRTLCVLEVRVYGKTPVNISWLVDGKLYSPNLKVENNVTKSKTPLLNLTTTTPIELRVSAGNDNIWRKNLTWPQDPAIVRSVGVIIGGVIGGIVVVVVVAGIAVYCFFKKNNGMFLGWSSLNSVQKLNSMQKSGWHGNGKEKRSRKSSTEMEHLDPDTKSKSNGSYVNGVVKE